MKPLRLLSAVLALGLLLGCGSGEAGPATEERPPVHVTYTPDPTAMPSELIEAMAEPSPEPDGPLKGARLYGNDWITLYRASRNGQPGICVETSDRSYACTEYLELPGTEGLSKLTITKKEIRPEGQRPEAYVLVYYLDSEGKERILCADNSHVDYTLLYPLSTEPSLALSEQQERYYGDLLLIGYKYEDFQRDKDRLSDPEGWESLCQRRILDALYYNYGDALPPYLTGEGPYGTTDQDATVISLAEMESFFQSTLGRPCLAHLDFDKEDRKDCPDLRSDRIVLYPTDYWFEPHVRQAVGEADGTITLYGYISGFELLYEDVICRIRPGEGYLGGQVVSAEISPAQIMDRRKLEASPMPTGTAGPKVIEIREASTASPGPDRPRATMSPAPDPVKEAAFLYAGESSIFYRGYRDGRPGICVEQLLWPANQNMLYQELPGTEGLSELTITDIESKPKGLLSKAYVYVRYLDNVGQERTVCFDHYGGDFGECYPLSSKSGMELTAEQQQRFDDLLLIAYLYEEYRRDSLSDPERWETLCQQFILDALYESYEETLPPYLTGEGIYDDEWRDTAILSQTELEAFFQSVLGRPNLVPDRLHYDEDFWPDLQPGQVPLPPTDIFVYAEAKQAVRESDGSVSLYGFASYGEHFYSAILTCRLLPTEGFLGYRIESTEMCPVRNDPAVTFAP